MPSLVSVIMSALQSVIVKLLIAFGIGIVSYGSLQYVLDQIKDWVNASFSGMPSDLYNLLLMTGVGSALGYIFAAYAFVVSYQLTSNIVTGITS